MKQTIRLDTIRLDDRAQPRAAISADRIAEYAEDMTRGDKFPPLIVFEDRKKARWLADGFHRYHSLVALQVKTLECDVRPGELRDAILFSCGANAAHGLRRTNADKRQAVTKLLADDEWSHWSDREIARQCRVDGKLVAKLREELAPVVTAETRSERTYRTKHGTTSKMKKGGGGKKPKDEPPELPLEPEPAPTEPAVPPQMAADAENGFISSALWEIERQLALLPPPVEAAARFPTWHHHTFTAAKLRGMADWLSEFAEAWRKREEKSHGEEGSQAAA